MIHLQWCDLNMTMNFYDTKKCCCCCFLYSISEDFRETYKACSGGNMQHAPVIILNIFLHVFLNIYIDRHDRKKKSHANQTINRMKRRLCFLLLTERSKHQWKESKNLRKKKHSWQNFETERENDNRALARKLITWTYFF